MLIKLGLEEDDKALERVVLKKIKTMDDLVQVYEILRVMITEGEECEIEVWQMIE